MSVTSRIAAMHAERSIVLVELRRRAQLRLEHEDWSGQAALCDAADAIERGEHANPVKGRQL